ncbi:MAG: four-carbon acid sugar kinase family protein [Opitutaceae bacterium]|nr:four-carbon acid sugar kinase family protein [Opitutaceae bacterium]
MIRSLAATLAELPPLPAEGAGDAIRAAVAANPSHKIVVLDDDPTGTQTVYDVPVLTTWNVAALKAEFARKPACFYVLTNSRSLPPAAARALNVEIARNLRLAAGDCTFTVISRSDSTLRGHFPAETDALGEILGPFDATFVIPYFEAGGRYTLDDVHYVAEGDNLVPAGETPFARDASFGYANSNLRAWIEEKSAQRVRAAEVHSLSIGELRAGPNLVVERLLALPKGAYCVVNACHPRDIEQFALAILSAERAGRRFLFRTAAQFVSARLGLAPRRLLSPRALNLPRQGGGLIIVGSHVPTTTEQLQRLLFAAVDLGVIELSVDLLLDAARREAELGRARAALQVALRAGRDVVLYTSRRLITRGDAAENLKIGRSVSEALITLVRDLEVRPRYIVAKGGITSSDVATRGLGVRRAMVRGQILPGVPVWETGMETRFPGLCYIVFPGNVGGPDALTDVRRILSA